MLHALTVDSLKKQKMTSTGGVDTKFTNNRRRGLVALSSPEVEGVACLCLRQPVYKHRLSFLTGLVQNRTRPTGLVLEPDPSRTRLGFRNPPSTPGTRRANTGRRGSGSPGSGEQETSRSTN